MEAEADRRYSCSRKDFRLCNSQLETMMEAMGLRRLLILGQTLSLAGDDEPP